MAEITLNVDRETLWAVTLDGVRHELWPGRLSVAVCTALRLGSHGALTWPRVYGQIVDGEIGPEEIAALVFVARRQAGEPVAFDAVVAAFDKVDEVRLDFEAHRTDGDDEQADEGAPDPEG